MDYFWILYFYFKVLTCLKSKSKLFFSKIKINIFQNMLRIKRRKYEILLTTLAIFEIFKTTDGQQKRLLKRDAHEDGLYQHTFAVFYENDNKAGLKHSLRDISLGRSDVQNVLTKENGEAVTPALLCVSGGWLVYNQNHYKMSSDSPPSLLSGSNNCIKPDETIKSMQPVTAHKFTSEGSITIFSKSHFSSSAHSFSAEESRLAGVKQLEEPIVPLASIIVTGESQWALMSVSGDVLCIIPLPSGGIKSSTSVCYASDLLKSQIENFHVSAIYPECPEQGDESMLANLRLTNCVDYGATEKVPLKTADVAGRAVGEDNVALECHPKTTKETKDQMNATKFSPEELELITKLINIRLDHDFNAEEQLLWPENPEDIWRTVPMDIAFDIVLATIPQNVVKHSYLKIIREFTMFHLNEMWKAKTDSTENDKLNRWKSHKTINHLLNKCLKRVQEENDQYSVLISSGYDNTRTIPEFEARINSALSEIDENDPIIETAWLISNYVMALCHQTFGYQVNFWDNFVTTFQHLYFMPLLSRWKTPSMSPKTFRLILGGYGTHAQYKRIAFSTSIMLEMTPNLHAFERYPTAA